MIWQCILGIACLVVSFFFGECAYKADNELSFDIELLISVSSGVVGLLLIISSVLSWLIH